MVDSRFLEIAFGMYVFPPLRLVVTVHMKHV